MTASNSGVSQVSQPAQGLEWSESGLYSVDSIEGYQVFVRKRYGQWFYSAYCSKEKITKNGDRWFFRELEYKEQYEIGERVPPAYDYRTLTAQLLLGMFAENDYGGTEAAQAAAKEACWLDWVEQNNKNGDK